MGSGHRVTPTGEACGHGDVAAVVSLGAGVGDDQVGTADLIVYGPD